MKTSSGDLLLHKITKAPKLKINNNKARGVRQSYLIRGLRDFVKGFTFFRLAEKR